MKILLKSVVLVDHEHPKNGETLDILINKGKIEAIAANIKNDGSAKEIKKKGLHISKGWIDLQANFQDPGFEHKETIKTALQAAAAGGFTTVCVSPQTFPVRDSKGQIDYLKEGSAISTVSVLPYGALSKNNEGLELSEFYDLSSAGAIGFTDDRRSVRNPNLLKNALLYSKSMDALVINFPYQSDISPNGVMNEGVVSTSLGLKGIPALAEELMVQRDLYILEYTGGKLHLNTLSSSRSIDLVSTAKKKALQVSCDVASYQLLLSDEELTGYDSRFKTIPPLRSTKEIKELIKRVKRGDVDALCSNHIPEDLDEKKKEFDLASFGVINLQTAVSAAISALESEMKIEEIIKLFTNGPARILGIKPSKIAEGEIANLTLFDPSEEYEFTKQMVLSKSRNSPFFKKKLKGKVYGIFNKGKAEVFGL